MGNILKSPSPGSPSPGCPSPDSRYIPSSTPRSRCIPRFRELGRTTSDDIAEAFYREHWRPLISFPLEHLIRTYTLWIPSHGPCTLKLRGDVMAPFLEYKGVNIRIGSDNCTIGFCGARNSLLIYARWEWARGGGGEIGMASRDLLRVQFSVDGSRILSPSRFRRSDMEDSVDFHGWQVSVEEVPMLRGGRIPTIPTNRPQKKINHIRCKTGALVYVIAFGYNDGTLRCYGDGGNLEIGVWSHIFGPLAEDEWVTEITQCAGDSLVSVKFHTNIGRSCVFGNDTGGQWRNDFLLIKKEYPGILNIRREANALGGGSGPMIVGLNEEVERHAGEEATPGRRFNQVFGDYPGEVPRDLFDTWRPETSERVDCPSPSAPATQDPQTEGLVHRQSPGQPHNSYQALSPPRGASSPRGRVVRSTSPAPVNPEDLHREWSALFPTRPVAPGLVHRQSPGQLHTSDQALSPPRGASSPRGRADLSPGAYFRSNPTHPRDLAPSSERGRVGHPTSPASLTLEIQRELSDLRRERLRHFPTRPVAPGLVHRQTPGQPHTSGLEEGPRTAAAELSIADQIRVAEVDECPICFESFLEGASIDSNGQRVIKCITAECGHAFCKSCVLNLSAMKAPDYLGCCAVCRDQFSTRNLFYIYTNDQGGQELRLLME